MIAAEPRTAPERNCDETARSNRGDGVMIPTDLAQPGLDAIVPHDSEIEQIIDGLLFGEGPMWHSAEGMLYWVDIFDDTIWKWSRSTGREIVMRPSGRANGMTFDNSHRLIVADWSSPTES